MLPKGTYKGKGTMVRLPTTGLFVFKKTELALKYL